MSYSILNFYGELQDFLPENNENGQITYPIKRKASIKDIIESLGPPHPEIGAIRANGYFIDFQYILKPKDSIHVYPHELPIEVTQGSFLHPNPIQKIRFIVDVNVGKLARLLRMLGSDTAYNWKWRDGYIADLAYKEGRIVLSKDHGLLKRKAVTWGRLIRSDNPTEQLQEVIQVFGLTKPFNLFSRCLRCNTILSPVDKSKILHLLEPKTKKYFNHFHICPSCKRIYWPGSHQEKMKEWLKQVI